RSSPRPTTGSSEPPVLAIADVPVCESGFGPPEPIGERRARYREFVGEFVERGLPGRFVVAARDRRADRRTLFVRHRKRRERIAPPAIRIPEMAHPKGKPLPEACADLVVQRPDSRVRAHQYPPLVA